MPDPRQAVRLRLKPQNLGFCSLPDLSVSGVSLYAFCTPSVGDPVELPEMPGPLPPTNPFPSAAAAAAPGVHAPPETKPEAHGEEEPQGDKVLSLKEKTGLRTQTDPSVTT